MPGFVGPQASSQNWASVMVAWTTAMNTGWLPDYSAIGSTGGFTVALSPFSAGSFYSTGDGTTGSGDSYYKIGRGLRVIQGATTVYDQVRSSISTGGQTLVGFSTATAGAALSTGTAIDSAAAGLAAWVPQSLTALSGIPAVVRKGADETVTNDTLQDDDELLYPVAANEVWKFEVLVLYDSGTIPDIKFAFTVPAGASLAWRKTQSAPVNTVTASGASADSVGQGAGTVVMDLLHGYVANGATAGNLQMQWAQATNDASDTKVLANSSLMLWRLA